MKYIKYEIKNALGNIFTIIFGFIFPMMMTLIFYSAFSKGLDSEALNAFKINLFMTNMLIAPLAIVFIGFSALFSQEIERNITLRMRLFGYTETKQLKAKFIAQFLVMLASLIIYSMVLLPILNLKQPNGLGIIFLLCFVFLIGLIFYILAFAISLLTKKFSITFGVSMSSYFGILVLSGMMGVQAKNLPVVLKEISMILPTTHLVNHINEIWYGKSFNWSGILLSFSGFLVFAVMLACFSIKKKNNA